MIGIIVSKKMATLHELDTVYGTKDLWDMIEILRIDSHNQAVLNTPAE